MEWKDIDYPLKKKFRAQKPIKKVLLSVFFDMKRPNVIDFLEKGAIVNMIPIENFLDNTRIIK